MARLIVKSSFVSPATAGGAAHLTNYVTYIATREGVELNQAEPLDPSLPSAAQADTRADLPPTEKQERLIRQMLQDFPDCKDSLEYEDYLAKPSMATASEFISRSIEDNFLNIHSREGYIQYLATRPGAQRDGGHGLWGQSDEPLDLDAASREVAGHDGNVWTHIISLRREDATKTGMENAAAWRDLVRSQAGNIAQAMGIPPGDLRWYAAFHNESHHPHIHMVAYSVGNAPYLDKKGLRQIRSGLAREIFREELLETYKTQTVHRDDLTSQWRELLARENGLSPVEAQMSELARYLSHHKGKAVYGYLPKQQRQLVNRIVDELGTHPRIQPLYDDWYAQQDKITGIYKETPEKRLPLSENKAFKSLKNAVIQTAAGMAAGATVAVQTTDTPSDDHSFPETPEPPPITPEEWLEQHPFPSDGISPPEQPYDNQPQLYTQKHSVPVEEKEKGWWTEEYKYARLLLYGNPDREPDPEAAFRAMGAEAATGNPLAQHDLGRMLLQGIGTEEDPEAATVWFQKALAGFKTEAAGNRPAYWQYRVGKMYAMGYGTEQDYTQSALWYQKAVDLDNPFAAYALAGQYYHGQGVEQNYETAFQLYGLAAHDEKNPSPYAMWELAKMCEQGIGIEKDPEAAAQWYAKAYQGFQVLEHRQLDEKLVYRLGWMEFHGVGTKQDIPAAVRHFERAVQLKNPAATYTLADLLAKGELVAQDVPRAAALLEGLKTDEFYGPMAAYRLGRLQTSDPTVWNMAAGIENLKFAADHGNHFATYTLGRIYLFGQGEFHDRELGLKYLRSAAEQGNNPAAVYTLANLLAKGELVEKDVPRAAALLEGLKTDEFYGPMAAYRLGRFQTSDPTVWNMAAGIENLKFAADHGNHFATYTLGRIYLFGQGEFHDRELGLKYLRSAAEQGNNPAAVYTLADLLVKGELVAQDVPRAAALLEDLKRDEFYAPIAAYRLGRLQTSDPTVWNMAAGIANLKFAADHGNHFATYTLGRIYLFGQGEFHDRELGLKYLRSAAEQGNEYAAQTLNQLHQQQVRQSAVAVLSLMRVFERSLSPRRDRVQTRASDRHQLWKEQEKKQAQGMN